MPGRTYTASAGYRFGYNGKEMDNEVEGQGDILNYGMRISDARLGKFLSVDPLAKKFPMLSPYQFASNSPMQNIDVDGLEGYKVVDAQAKTTTLVVDIYYVPKTKDNFKLYNSGFTQKEVEKIKKGIMSEFATSKFLDDSHVEPVTGQAYTVDLQINLHPVTSKTDAYKEVSCGTLDVANGNMLLEKEATKEIDLPNGLVGTVEGGSVTGVLKITDAEDSHNATHELFHNFIHNHPNASEALSKQIDPKDQETGHKEAGGIFVYENKVTGTQKQNLNQKNINDALNTVPEKK